MIDCPLTDRFSSLTSSSLTSNILRLVHQGRLKQPADFGHLEPRMDQGMPVTIWQRFIQLDSVPARGGMEALQVAEDSDSKNEDTMTPNRRWRHQQRPLRQNVQCRICSSHNSGWLLWSLSCGPLQGFALSSCRVDDLVIAYPVCRPELYACLYV